MFPFRFNRVVTDMFAYGERVGRSTQQPEGDLLTIIAQSKLNGELLPQEFLDGSWLLIILRATIPHETRCQAPFV